MKFTIRIPRFTIPLLIPIIFIASCNKATLPVVTTGTVTRIQQTNAYSGGQLTSDGGAHVSSMGVCWNTSADPTVSNNKTRDTTSLGLFTSHITGLTPNTMYYVKAYATNSEGTAYGDQVSFTSAVIAVPTLITSGLKSVTLTTAASGGEISNDGGVAVTVRGVCWNTTGLPTLADSHTSDGSGSSQFFSTLTDLTINTTYFVRAYATNSVGTGFGNEVQFTQSEPVVDTDGNAYSVVTIGSQVWLGENLKTTRFNDDITIPYVTDGIAWANTSTPAFCWYKNSESGFKSTYGGLYNWYAVNTGKLCPTGWHVPSVDEYVVLLTYLGGDKIAGGKLKEAGLTHWSAPNLGATNGSGFTALPGGGRYNINSEGGAFSDMGYVGYHWSATAGVSASNAISYDLAYSLNSVVKIEYSKRDGGSVRCIKNSN